MKSVYKLRIAAALSSALVLFAFPLTHVLAQNDQGSTGATPRPSPMMIPVIPQITLSPLPGYGPSPLMVGFMVASSDPGGPPLQTFRWNFGDGEVSTLPPSALFHTFTRPGSYVVTVTATTLDGHQASAFAGVIVTSPIR